MKTKVSATVDSQLLAKLEEETGMTRSQLLEEALRHYQSFLVEKELEQFYSQHEETADEEYATEIAQMNIEAAVSDE
ncbi:ribbon-helix-helix protein, CopG family [Euhalothece natronophila Z-M001]|uniref:Ribbon-helix-helix protein, CopG family n=1 Tax=Euhalothece natronophila Z-M001 TaxID=522448 RepID=A0A5B8NLK0_9CHRO|nr:ribbon-helix-helix protein, CopG family [Euhalothece natronophila]QDZ39807.1 ribbon-helix-helix protein, CopG family [Euhalothece natronophila Z-M001]